MSVDSRHPFYDQFAPIWTMMRDCEEGEESVKSRTTVYLPMPSGFRGQADGGLAMYTAYQTRAMFPDILQPTLAGMVGVIHRKDAQIEGLEEGKPLAYMWERCTQNDKLPLEVFHRRITAEILLTGRYGVLTDVASDGDGEPYMVGYAAEQIINWSEYENDLFVLDESRKVRGEQGTDEFAWNDEKRYRVLRLTDNKYSAQVYGGEQQMPGEEVFPNIRGGKGLVEIPFAVGGPREISARVIDPPPLKGVARASLAIYRLDADYRHQLFNTGQETLFIIGETDNLPKVVGSGVTIGLPLQCEAKYVGPQGIGISAHRTAIMDERQGAVAAGVKLFDTKADAESGEALRLRAAAQTATLVTIAQTSAAVLEKALRYAAQFVGQDPEQIVVKPNLEFVDVQMTPADAAKLVEVWQSGAISKQTLYEDLQKGGIASEERDFEEEQDLINQEAIDNPQGVLSGGMTGQPQLAAPGPRLNGGAAPAAASRFIETGAGLQVTPAAGNA